MANKPTPRQLRYLRSLAERTGQTFTYPTTFADAGREIDRLKAVRPESRAERRIERELIADQLAIGPVDSARVREDEISGRGSSATWAHHAQREPQSTSDRLAPKRTTPVVGKRTELARYTVAEGERVVYGQRVDGVVRFQPEDGAVVEVQSSPDEDSSCRPGAPTVDVERADAARPKRPNEEGDRSGTTEKAPHHRGKTGRRVELARYRISTGERVLYGQRVDGVVRVTDVPSARRGRAYLVERGLEEEGPNANAALTALLADYVRQAGILDEVPIAASPI